MKTVRKWFDQLPSPVREQAFSNVGDDKGILNAHDTSLYRALAGAFTWGQTKEGHQYWEEIQRKYSSLI